MQTIICSMKIVRFHLEPWQRGGSEFSSPSSTSISSLLFLSPSTLRRQRAPSFDDLSSIDTTLFEKKPKIVLNRKIPQMVKKLSVLCSNVLATSVKFNSS